MSAPALDGLSFAEFQRERARLLASRPELVDRAEANLYASLRAWRPGEFEPVEPSDAAASRHRCHVAELFLARWGWPDAEKPRLALCRGVRDALGAMCERLAAEGRRALLPSDVYPVYLELARAAGLRFSTYEARVGLPSDAELRSVDALLVCDPLKPWGGALSGADASRLGAWARARPGSRLLMLDAAYDVDWTEHGRALVESGAAMGLASLSKGWLEPLRAGVAVSPPEWAERARAAIGARPKDELGLRVGYRALAELGDRPARIAAAVAELRARAAAELAPMGEAPFEGSGPYLEPSARSAAEWLRLGALAMPASVFGSTRGGSVLSCLPSAPPRA